MPSAGIDAPEPGPGTPVRTLARSLSVMQKEALVTSNPASTTWRLSSDEGAYLDGDDAAPCPLAHMTTGMVSSFMESAQTVSRQRGVALPGLCLIQDNYYTMTGSALKGTMRGGALPVRLRAELPHGTDMDAARGVLEEAIRVAPVAGLLRTVLKSQFTLTHNGAVIETGSVPRALDEPLRFEASWIDDACPESGDWSALMRRDGPSPTTDEVTSSPGSSYADQQSRQLHLRGICRTRPDGIKSIEQQLFNPHGSIFHLLSEESESAGGRGRAPDAASYISAGLAFCFLTQFGRYAKIVKKPLREYAVAQDTRFPAPGSGAAARPVVTHVYLETGESDEFARNALDMAEQTCFLHALCRTDIGVDLDVVEAAD
jgi:organic hydroperoxide reductase OsmC/OhrA